MNPRYPSVSERAGHRCEYCQAPEVIFNFRFEVEHVVPRSRGGSDNADCLALSRRSCNHYKTDHITAYDAESELEVPLFHPRQDAWLDHFDVDPQTGEINGLTPVGRATVNLLQFNSPGQLAAREKWIRLGLFP